MVTAVDRPIYLLHTMDIADSVIVLLCLISHLLLSMAIIVVEIRCCISQQNKNWL